MKKIILILLGIILLSASAGPAAADHHAVKIAARDGIGQYLTDAKGMTLYWFKMDGENQSACTGDCLEKWPVYYREGIAAPLGVDTSDFGTITRADGRKQTTFRSFPLYYFFKDKDPGDTFGQGVKNVWYVIDPASFPPK